MCLQILANPSHHFIDSSLYKDVILVAWDPAPYSANLNLVSIFLMPWTVGQTVPDDLTQRRRSVMGANSHVCHSPLGTT